ncbi:MAG: RNA methyltransferase [Clostridia bacterium]|nr:RNA methyltransferase [Clostridia bacterium]
MIIVSKSNEKIKYINSLKDKKYRDKYNKYILEGIKLVNEQISSGDNTLEFIVISRELLNIHQGGNELYEKLKDLDNVLEVDEKIFAYLSDTETPQGALIVLDKKKCELKDLINNINNNEKIIVLDKVQDAGNMGTIIRTAVAFGINNVVCIKGSVDVYSSKVIRSTMGAIHKTNIFYVNLDEMKEIKKALEANGYDLCGTDLKATKYLNETKPNNKTVYVLGNEANGMSEEMKELCSSLVKIPMESVQESLNVGVAAAILMYNGYIGGEA